MKGKAVYDLKRLIAGLMVLTISLLMVNRAFYIHIHVLPNGTMVSHAHPFSKSTDNGEEKDHQHSSLEFLLLEQMDVLIFSAIALFVLLAFSQSMTLGRPDMDRLLPSLVPISPSRAPPSCM